MNAAKLKRVIARQGLIVLGMVVFGILLTFLSERINKDHFPFKMLPGDYYDAEIVLANKIRSLGEFLILFGYPFYLLVSFVIWATKTLKVKRKDVD